MTDAAAETQAADPVAGFIAKTIAEHPVVL